MNSRKFSIKQYLQDMLLIWAILAGETVLGTGVWVVLSLLGVPEKITAITCLLFCVLLVFSDLFFFPPQKELLRRGLGNRKKA